MDLIERQAAIDALDEIESEVADGYGYQYEKWRKYFCGLPSAQPEPSDAVYRLYKRAYEAGQRNAQPEPHFDEWCNDCKEYDQERHRCPRWNRVIRETLKDAQPEQPEIIRCKDCKWKQGAECVRFAEIRPFPDDFCSRAERREK